MDKIESAKNVGLVPKNYIANHSISNKTNNSQTQDRIRRDEEIKRSLEIDLEDLDLYLNIQKTDIHMTSSLWGKTKIFIKIDLDQNNTPRSIIKEINVIKSIIDRIPDIEYRSTWIYKMEMGSLRGYPDGLRARNQSDISRMLIDINLDRLDHITVPDKDGKTYWVKCFEIHINNLQYVTEI